MAKKKRGYHKKQEVDDIHVRVPTELKDMVHYQAISFDESANSIFNAMLCWHMSLSDGKIDYLYGYKESRKIKRILRKLERGGD